MNIEGLVIRFLLIALILDGAASQGSTTEASKAMISSTEASSAATSFDTNVPDLGPTTVMPYDASGASFCTCDVTSGSCDVNCCCDLDCNTNDRAAFSKCEEQLYDSTTQYCLQTTVIYTKNVEYVVNTTSPYLFCIQADNYAERNFYSSPNTVSNSSAFSEYENRYGSYSYSGALQSSQTAAATLPTLQPFYQTGDPVLTLFGGNLTGYFSIPQGYANSECEDFRPAGFWYDVTSSCTRSLAVDLAKACNSSSYLNMHSFYSFRIAKGTGAANLTADDRAFDNSSFIGIGLDGVTCFSSGGLPITCSVSSPSYNSSSTLCLNAVTQVSYVITLDTASTMIRSVNVSFTLQHLSATQFPLVQTYSVTWTQAATTNVFKRSGNPGYLRGQPVLAGQLIQDNAGLRYEIALSGNRNNYLTLVTSKAGGSCLANPLQRTPIRFGTDLRSGCALSVSYQNMTSAGICNTIYSAILNALLGDTFKLDSSIYVATFGNSLANVTGDWVPMLVAQQPLAPPVSTGTGTCQSMILGMHVDFLYANIGPLANPQAKIIGAQLSLLTGQAIQYSCTGAFACESGSAGLRQTFEISSSVAFVDVSRPSTAAIAEQPVITAKIPYDFFYPFYLPSSALPKQSPDFAVLVASAVFFLFI